MAALAATNLVLLLLADPVRVAEDAATPSLLTGGRFELGVGLGYREREFDAFGRSRKNRPSLMEEGLAVVRRSWSGEPLSAGARRIEYVAPKVVPRVREKLRAASPAR